MSQNLLVVPTTERNKTKRQNGHEKTNKCRGDWRERTLDYQVPMHLAMVGIRKDDKYGPAKRFVGHHDILHVYLQHINLHTFYIDCIKEALL